MRKKEKDGRLATVTLPKLTTTHEKQILAYLIDIVQQDLSNCNHYAHDV